MKHKVATVLAIGGAAFGGFVAAALLFTLLDIYLAGHGIEPLGNRPLLDVDTLGIHLSVGDCLALGIAVIAAMAPGLAIRWSRPR